MAVLHKKEEKIEVVLSKLPKKYTDKEFVDKFIQLYSKDWGKIKANYIKQSQDKEPGTVITMPKPDVYLKNILDNYLTNRTNPAPVKEEKVVIEEPVVVEEPIVAAEPVVKEKVAKAKKVVAKKELAGVINTDEVEVVDEPIKKKAVKKEPVAKEKVVKAKKVVTKKELTGVVDTDKVEVVDEPIKKKATVKKTVAKTK